jgi:hypothetical protein
LVCPVVVIFSIHPSVLSSIHPNSSSQKKKKMEEEEDDEWWQEQFIQMFMGSNLVVYEKLL